MRLTTRLQCVTRPAALHLNADIDGGRRGRGLVLHCARRLHHVADHQRAQPLGHLRREVPQHLFALKGSFVLYLEQPLEACSLAETFTFLASKENATGLFMFCLF